jgi:putative ABC transport system permease protein
LFWIAYRALKGRLALALLSVLGVAMAVGLAVSVPVFAQAVSRAIMEEELAKRAQELNRSPLTMRHYLLPSSQNPMTSETCREMAVYIGGIYHKNLGLPVVDVQVKVESGGMLFKTADDGPYGPAGAYLSNVTLGFITGIENHVAIASGDPLGSMSPEGVANVWLHESWARELGIQAGERFTAQPVLQAVPIPVRVAGTWQPRDLSDPFWPTGGDSTLRTLLIVHPDDYALTVEPYLANMPVAGVSWMIRLDESAFVPELAERYVEGLQRAETEVRQMLPNVQSDVTPQPILQAHLDRRQPLTILLFGFTVPITGFLLYFLLLVSRIVVENQRRVIATLVSRGMSPEQVFQINLYQALIILALGTPPGIAIGIGAARLMGHTSSFMAFVARSGLDVSLRSVSVWLILLTLTISLVARLWPSIQESRWGMVEYAARTVRTQANSLFSKLHLELLLVVPTWYLYHQLRAQGSIGILGWKSSGDIFRDPALFVVPALFVLTAALWAARVFPLLMRALDRVIAGWLGVVGCLTLRQLGRRSRDYVSSLLLIIASLSIGVFMASMALSLDRWLKDRTLYPLGADVVVKVVERMPERSGVALGMDAVEPLMELVNPDGWLIPRDELMAIPGVQGATWVGHYRALIPVSPTATARGQIMAIDRQTFPSAAAYRSDFSPMALGELMNRLGSQPNGILVSSAMQEQGARQIGDTVTLRVSTDGVTEREYPAVIVGVFEYFPTVFPGKTPAVIGNLDHIITMNGGVASYEVWLRAEREAIESRQVALGLAEVVPVAIDYDDIWERMAAESEAKERIGVYGTLTLGFLASLTLSGIGLLIQYQRSLHERLSRFAVLRALGLSRGELFAHVQLEYLLVLLVGLATGVVIGVQASQLFIPFFRVSTSDGTLPIPPLMPLLDRERILAMTIVFGAVQFVAQIGLIWRAMRSELFQVLRMGNQE